MYGILEAVLLLLQNIVLCHHGLNLLRQLGLFLLRGEGSSHKRLVPDCGLSLAQLNGVALSQFHLFRSNNNYIRQRRGSPFKCYTTGINIRDTRHSQWRIWRRGA